MKTTTRRPITLSQARAQFVHRFTMEHVPQWAKQRRENGTYYAPHYRTDQEWYENTLFYGESDLATRKFCYSSNQTWPLGNALSAPYSRQA